MRIRTWLGILLVVSGTVLVAAQTGGVTTTSADRGVSVAVAAPEEAFLGLEDTYGGQEIRNYVQICFFGCFNISVERNRNVAEIRNQVAENFTGISAEVGEIDGAPDGTLTVTAAPDALDVGEVGEIEVGCSGDVGATGEGDVILEITAEGEGISVYGAPVTVEDASFTCTD